MKTLVFCALALFGSSSAVSAATFDVNLVLDDFFVSREDGARDRAVTVTGSIETDKTSGALTAANLVSWSFSFTDGVKSFVLDDETPGLFTGALNNRFDAYIDGNILMARDFNFMAQVNDGETLLHNQFVYRSNDDKLVYNYFIRDLPAGTENIGFVGHENNVSSPFVFGSQPALSLAVRSSRVLVEPDVPSVPLPAGVLFFATALLGSGALLRVRKTPVAKREIA